MHPQRSIRFCLSLLAVTFFLLACPQHETPAPAPPTKETIVILTYGGEFAKAQRKAYFDPFEKATGIHVSDVAYNSEYGLLKAGVQSGQPQWDVVDIDSSSLVRGVRDGLFERIDYRGINKADLIPQGVNDFAVATDLYSVALAWNTDAERTPPRSWSDLWNLKTFPGWRTLQASPKFTLEIALLADGVKPADIYTHGLDVDRAFRSLDKIKSSVHLWWTTGQQPVQALAANEVSIGAAYGARVVNAHNLQHLPVSTTWDADIIDIEYWAVPKGARHSDAAMRFVAFASGPEHQAAFAREIPLGLVNKRSSEFLPADLAANLNTAPANLRDQVFFDAGWWADNEQAVTERFNTWRSH